MNKLTCVITFLNEHIEVFRTVKSIRDSVGDQVDIVLVNDCSEDGIEYKVIANQFNCKYVLNQHRQGVANSRDIGVMMAETDYCMILDAHMRFYDDTWLPRMIEEIDANPKRLYCTGCQALWWPLEEDKYQHVNLGAYLTFNFNNHYDSLEPKWTKTKNRPDGTEAIPIILGANYGFAKEYYAYIGGDDGLLMYGGDEAWLSLKSWALGDGCAILNDVIIGHVFRERHPYVAPLREAIYNKCFIIAVIFPEKTEWLAWLFDQGGKPVQDLFIERTEQIKKTRRWFLGYRLKGWHAIFNKINREFYKR